MKNRIEFVNSINFGENKFINGAIKYFDQCMLLFNIVGSYSDISITGSEMNPNVITFTATTKDPEKVSELLAKLSSNITIMLYGNVFSVEVIQTNDVTLCITLRRMGRA